MSQQFAPAARRLSGQPMFQILSRIQEMERAGESVIHFEIGDPDFPSPPCVIEAAKDALDGGWTHYSDPMGDYELRQTVCQTRFFTPGFQPRIGQVVISPGANILIYAAVRCLAEPGDEVIIPNPSFSTYQSVLDFCGVKAVYVPLRGENGFQMMAADVARAITDKTRLVIVNSPNNPTGAATAAEELEKIGKLCLERGIYLYCDEIYAYLNYTGQTLYSPSVLDECRERVIVASGFSKAFAMTGWRLGVGIGPEELMRKFALLLETTVSCVPAFSQRAAIRALRQGLPEVRKMVEVYRERRDYLVERLGQMPGIRCLKPEGAFYVFPNIAGLGMRDLDLSDRLLKEAKIGVCPGSYFGDFGKDHIRLCYAASMDSIRQGMDRMEAFIRRL